MANLSSRTGLSPTATRLSLSNNAATSVQNFNGYDSQVLEGHVYIDATTNYRASVRVTIVKNGAGVYEIAATDIAGDDNGGSPIVSFSMSGSILQATLVSYSGFSSAYIQYYLLSPAQGLNFPLSVDASAVASGTIDAARLPLATSSSAGAIPYYEEGTFTMTLGNASNTSGHAQSGPRKYIRIGNMVQVWAGEVNFSLTDDNVNASFVYSFSGLPNFTAVTYLAGVLNTELVGSPYERIPSTLLKVSDTSTDVFFRISSDSDLGMPTTGSHTAACRAIGFTYFID